MALINISKGETSFDASYKDIEDEIFGTNPGCGSRRSTIRKRIESLERFQELRGVELIVRSQLGHRVESGNGFQYFKTRYELRLISGLVSAFHSGNPLLIETEINSLQEKSKTESTSIRLKRPPQFRQDMKDLKTARTKLLKVSANQIRNGTDPNQFINPIIESVRSEIEQFQRLEIEARSKRQFIKKFETDMLASGLKSDSHPTENNESCGLVGGVHLLSPINHFPPEENEWESGESDSRVERASAEMEQVSR